MAYVNVADWKPDQVTDWLKGLDSCILPYIHSFLNNQVNGQQLLSITYDDLEKLGVYKLGHQELILEAVEHLQNFHYELDRETLQLLALRVSCLAHSLHNELRHNHCNSHLVSTQTLADVANIVTAVKPLVCWLDRPPFNGHLDYNLLKPDLLSLSLEMATSGQRDRFAEHPVEEIRNSCGKLASLADSIIQDTKDPLLLQPASLDLATLKKRSSDDLGFYIVPSFHGIHQIGDLKCNSAAHQCGKIEPGDEIVQINYQTVVGWQVKQVMALFEESPTEVLLTLKKRPRHTKVYGQIYMKPYRLPSKKKTQRSYTRWHENIPSPRPELLTIPDFEMPLPKSIVNTSVETTVSDVGVVQHLASSSSEEEGEGVLGTTSSPTSVRIYLPKPRIPVQRRATITGASPISKTAPIDLQQFWQELKLEREWRGGDSTNIVTDKSGRSQLIQDCEEAQLQLSQLSPRKYSSFDSLKTKPDLVSSCQPDNLIMLSRNFKKSTESIHDEVFKTTENSPRRKSSDSDDVFRTPDSSGVISKKSSVSDDVFTSVDNNYSSNSKSTGDNSANNSSYDNDLIECRKISLKEKIEMFSKGGPSSDGDKIRSFSTGSGNPNINRINIKPKVPARTFRLSPEKTASSSTPPQVVARVINNKDEMITNKISNNLSDVDNAIKTKERGRLDKSHSTPAYDFNIDVNIVQKYEKNKEIMIGKLHHDKNKNEMKNDRKQENTEPVVPKSVQEPVASSVRTETVEQVHGQMVETINQHLLKMNDESDLVESRIESSHVSVPPRTKDQKTGSDSNETEQFNLNEENEKTEKIGKILETISSSIAEHRRKEMEKDNNFIATRNTCDDGNKHGSNSIGVADLSKTISQVCQEEILQTYNPSNYTSNAVCESDLIKSGVVGAESTHRGVLPVPPRVRITPPVLPDVTITSSTGHANCNESNYGTYSTNSSNSSTPPEMPKRKPVSNMEFIDNQVKPVAPATFPRHQKPETQRPITPPEPPPRPTPPVRGACYRAMLAAKSMGKSAASSVASPKALRKKNPLLAKMRNVSVAELGQCDCQGWLQQRCRKFSGQWNTGWFIIKGTTFYGFANKESQKAHCLISLPGFTVSPADEVKSRKYAFKVYHTGTIFYFAANSQEELTAWLDCFSMATMIQDTLTDSILFSESEGEMTSDEVETESCFRSPKMKKLTTLLSGAPSSPRPARSHQNLTAENKSGETQKKFSSLKKFGGRKTSSSPSGSTSSGPGSIGDADGNANVTNSTTSETNSSLDRKYLRFLDRGHIRPIPTAQFRSYRRVAPPLPRQHPHPLHQSAESVLTLESGVGNPVIGGNNCGTNSFTDSSNTRSSAVLPTQANHILPTAIHPLHHHIQHHHHRPADMADYRLASLSKNRQRAVEEHDTTGFITLEALMLARQEEERRQAAQMNASSNITQANINTPPVPQPRTLTTISQGHQQQRTNSGSISCGISPANVGNHKINNNLRSVSNSVSNNSSNRSATTSLPSSSRNFNNNSNNSNNNTYPYRNTLTSNTSTVRGGDENHGSSASNIMKPVRSMFTSHRSHQKPSIGVDYRDGSPEKFWIDSLRGNANNINLSSGGNNNANNINSKRLKKAALYQPPPVAPLDTAGVSSDDSRMQLKFEMFLDQNQTSSSPIDNQSSTRRRCAKASNVHTPASRLKSLFSSGSNKQDNQKTLLGSPRLHRAIFRNSSSSSRGCGVNGGSGDSGGESLNSPPLSPPEDIESSLQDVVHCPSSSPSTPDYPGLEYPPVFEPGTYSLSDASTLLACRNNSNRDDR